MAKKFDKVRFCVKPLGEQQPFTALDANDIRHHPHLEQTGAISLLHFTAFFQGEDKTLERGEHHYKSGHVEGFSHADGEMVRFFHASRREQRYKISVSVMTH